MKTTAMKVWMAGAAFVLLAISVPAKAATVFQYARDDGTGNTAVGFESGAGDLIWLNQFDVVPPYSRIGSISVSFGFTGFGPPNGTPVTVALWKDPNNDDNPNDAVLLTTGAGVIANSGTNIFNEFDIADTDVVSGSFFVGALVRNIVGPGFPDRTDTTTPGTGTWYVIAGAGTANLANLSSAFQVPSFGNAMVRANAVPEPGTLALLGLGLAGLAATRRRKQ